MGRPPLQSIKIAVLPTAAAWAALDLSDPRLAPLAASNKNATSRDAALQALVLQHLSYRVMTLQLAAVNGSAALPTALSVLQGTESMSGTCKQQVGPRWLATSQ
jgi:hypothetical protein